MIGLDLDGGHLCLINGGSKVFKTLPLSSKGFSKILGFLSIYGFGLFSGLNFLPPFWSLYSEVGLFLFAFNFANIF